MGDTTVVTKVKFTDFVKRATSLKMQLAEFRFHINFKVDSLLGLTKYRNLSEYFKLTREAERHPHSEAFVHLLKFSQV